MAKRKRKITKAVLLDTGEDAVPARLGVPLGFHLPFECLQAYYDGGIHRPEGSVGDVSQVQRVGHEIYSIVGMFGDGGLKGSWLEDGVFIAGHQYACEDVVGAHIRGDRTTSRSTWSSAWRALTGGGPTPPRCAISRR